MVNLTSSGKLHQQFRQGGRKQQSLSSVWKSADDLLKLLSKAHFEQPDSGKHFRIQFGKLEQ